MNKKNEEKVDETVEEKVEEEVEEKIEEEVEEEKQEKVDERQTLPPPSSPIRIMSKQERYRMLLLNGLP